MVANYTTHDSELQSPTEITVRRQTKGWMVNEFVTELEDQGLFLKKLAMPVLNALTDAKLKGGWSMNLSLNWETRGCS